MGHFHFSFCFVTFWNLTNMDLPTTKRNNVNWHAVKKQKQKKQPEPQRDARVASTTTAAIQESYPFKMNKKYRVIVTVSDLV